MPHQLTASESAESPLSRLGGEPSRSAPYLRAILTFVKVSGEEQLKQIPVIGPLLLGAGEALKELSEEADDQQLEQRVERLLTVGEQTQEDIRLLAGLAGLIFAQQRQLLEQLRAEGLSADMGRLTGFATEAALIAYQSRVARDYQYVDNRGIEGGTRAEHASALPLDDIYVTPRLMPERERENVREREKDVLARLLSDRDLTSEQRVQLEEEYAVISGERWRPGTKMQDEGLALGRTLERAPHAVIIGGPGVGKSVLTRYLARACALGRAAMTERLGWSDRLVPVLVPLAAFADARSRRAGLKLRDFLRERVAARGGEALRVAIDEELDKGRVYVILDGVDEVPDSHSRAAIVQAVDEFILDHADNRFLVTSRPYGYIRLAGDLSHFQLLNFSPAQVEEFIHGWQRAFERRQHPEAPNFEDAKEQADALVEEIMRSPKVSELATNPLMLVIISLIRYEKARLPEERVQLYNRAVNTLMDTWNQWRSQQAKEIGGATLPLDRLIRVWGAVAEWMRREKPTGVVHRAELKRELARVLEEKEYDEDTPQATAEAYLRAAADRAGLLEERGFEIFGFWHPTFEEFLAAVELTTPTGRAVERLLPLRGDPRWREVILLAVGYVGVVQRDNDTATQIVEALAFRDTPPEEPITHACLRLAADCIADDVGVKRTLAQQVIVELAGIIQRQPYEQLRQVFVKTVRALPNLRARPETIAALAPLARYDLPQVRMEAARLFSNVAAENPEALRLCEQLLRDETLSVRCHAALGLARAEDDRPEVWQALLAYHNGAVAVRPAALKFLLPRVAEAKAHWLPLLDSKEHRASAADALIALKEARSEVLQAVSPRLDSADPNERLDAARVMSKCGEVDKATAVFMSVATEQTGAPYDPSKVSAVYYLALQKHADERLTSVLVDWVISDGLGRNIIARHYLRTVEGMGDRVLDPLTAAQGSDDLAVRFRAAETLLELKRPERISADAIRPCLTAKDVDIRLRAARLLYLIGQIGDEDLNLLTPLLSSGVLLDRLNIAAQLAEMGRGTETVAETLMSALSSSEEDIYLPGVVGALQSMGSVDDKVTGHLLSLLAVGSLQKQIEAADCLVSIGRESLAVEHIAKLADPQPWVALGAYQKVLSGQPISTADGEALAALINKHPGDTENQSWARDWMFSRIWEALEPKEGAAA